MLNIANLTGQLTIMGVIYYLAFSNSIYAGAALVLGHVLYEGSTYLFQQSVLKEVARYQQQYQKRLEDDLNDEPQGHC